MKKVLGWFILISLVALFIGMTIYEVGVAKTLIAILIATISTGLLTLGLELIGL